MGGIIYLDVIYWKSLMQKKYGTTRNTLKYFAPKPLCLILIRDSDSNPNPI